MMTQAATFLDECDLHLHYEDEMVELGLSLDDCDQKLRAEVLELESLPHVLQALPGMLRSVLFAALSEIIVSYLGQSVMLKSSIDDEPPVKVTSPYLAIRSVPFEMKLQTGDVLVQFPFSTSSLHQLVMYTHAHRLHEPPAFKGIAASKQMSENTSCLFDAWFSDQCDTKAGQLVETLSLANFLGMSCFLNLLSVKITSKIQGVETANLLQVLNLPSSCTDTPMPTCLCPYH